MRQVGERVQHFQQELFLPWGMIDDGQLFQYHIWVFKKSQERFYVDGKRTPFHIILGYKPIGVPPAFEKMNVPAVEHKLSELLKIREEALAAHELAGQLVFSSPVKSSFLTSKWGNWQPQPV